MNLNGKAKSGEVEAVFQMTKVGYTRQTMYSII